jgi:AraC-like DNA-binding protein/ligand-binding sensor protein
MKQIAIDDLSRLPVIRHYETAFCKATGVPLHVVLPSESDHCLGHGRFRGAFCAMVSRTPGCCIACLGAERPGQKGTGQKFGPQEISCIAGLTLVRVPVFVEGQHVATLVGGPVFSRPRTESDFLTALKNLKRGRNNHLETGARRAYFETPVVALDRLQAVVHLLNVFAHYLADHAGRHAASSTVKDSRIISGAKQFIQSHLQDALTLGFVAQHVHVSRFYFCKMFKKTTGMTLTEYVARVRVERAKTLLGNPSVRVSEVAYAAGFGSIPRFNSVFKRCVGMPPTEYRETL